MRKLSEKGMRSFVEIFGGPIKFKISGARNVQVALSIGKMFFFFVLGVCYVHFCLTRMYFYIP